MFTILVLVEFVMLAVGVVALFRGKLSLEGKEVSGNKARLAALFLILPLPVILILRTLIRSGDLNIVNFIIGIIAIGIAVFIVQSGEEVKAKNTSDVQETTQEENQS
jgi:hypothetical protein